MSNDHHYNENRNDQFHRISESVSSKERRDRRLSYITALCVLAVFALVIGGLLLWYAPQEKVKQYPYTIVDETIHDVPVKAQISQKITMPTLNQNGALLTEGLRQAFMRIRERGPFKYHSQVTAVWIWAFNRPEDASNVGNWIGMLEWRQGMAEPKISIRLPTKSGGALRFGLTVAKRKSIFLQLVLAERQADAEAYQMHPSYDRRHAQLSNQLLKHKRSNIAKSHNVTLDVLDKIAQEGIDSNWPQP